MLKKRCKYHNKGSCLYDNFNFKKLEIFSKNNILNSSKSQITIFIVLGLMLIILIMFFLFTTKIMMPQNALYFRTSLEMNFDTESLNALVNYCFANFTNEMVRELALNGGTFDETEINKHSKVFEGNNYRYLCVHLEGSKYCVNRILTRKDMEIEMQKALEKNMQECLDFSFMSEKGYEIITGEMKIDVKIAIDDINFILEYPILMIRGDNEIREELFYYSQKSPLGMMHRLVVDIINHETTHGFFNKDKWMNENNKMFTILKNRPYPAITYDIISKSRDRNRDFIFRFSLLRENKASGLSRLDSYDTGYGCCYINYEGSCYKNADVFSCSEKNGSYVNVATCVCSDNFRELGSGEQAISQSYKNCGDYLDGESWCLNLGGIGGRSIKYSCHDGIILEEPCEDFHGEVCIEYRHSNKLTAECKINRWEDCARCVTKDCCENAQLRDCIWHEINYDNVVEESRRIQCTPKQSPGFRFWEASGQEICNFGTSYARCQGHACDNSWVNHVAYMCSFLGDCGIKNNYLGTLTRGGYLQTSTNNVNLNYFKQKDEEINETGKNLFTLERQRSSLFNVARQESIPLISTLLSAGLRFLNDAANNRRLTIDYSFCGSWQAPVRGDCSQCGKSAIPCSEYSCYSLGDNCIYFEEEGFGNCKERESLVNEIIIGFNSDLDYTIDSIEIFDKEIFGYRINQVLPPYTLIDFILNTSVETKCKITYLPNMRFTETPAIWFGDSMFSKQHKVSLRLPEKIKIPDRLYRNLGINSLEELFYLITTNDEILKEIFDNEFYSVLERLNELIENRDYIREVLNLTVSGLDNNEYYTFVRCADSSGNENEDPIFIWFKINETFVDDKPPKLLGTIPANNSVVDELYTLEIYLDEPAECKLDELDLLYGAMRYNFNCQNDRMQLSGLFGGSYLCSIETEILNPYIRCVDNPPVVRKYNFNLVNAENTSEISYYFNDSQIVLFESNMLYDGINQFENIVYLPVQNKLYELNFILPDLESCRIGTNDFNFNLMYELNCEEINELNPFFRYGDINCSRSFGAGNYEISILCVGDIPEKQNINTESYSLNFNLNNILEIVSVFPEDLEVTGYYVDLGVVVNQNIVEEGVNCGYLLGNSEELIQMSFNSEYQFRTRLYGLERDQYNVLFVCTDKHGSLNYKEINFVKS